MSDIITLVTDFGLDGPYVAVMKGVILGINPGAVIVDISHAIEPQNIAQAAFLLGTAHRYFPEGTIHVAVVDPGVGSRRRAIILKTPSAYFVAPDNGILSYVLAEASARASEPETGERELSPGLEAVAITNPRFWRHPVSSTFHGRDIFAPVASHLSLGVPLHQFGEAIRSLFAFALPQPHIAADGLVIGHIVHIDHFGNLITDIGSSLIDKDILIEVSGHQITGLSSCYAEGDELLALIGSSGNLEIAVRDDSAARRLRAELGSEVRVRAISRLA